MVYLIRLNEALLLQFGGNFLCHVFPNVLSTLRKVVALVVPRRITTLPHRCIDKLEKQIAQVVDMHVSPPILSLTHAKTLSPLERRLRHAWPLIALGLVGTATNSIDRRRAHNRRFHVSLRRRAQHNLIDLAMPRRVRQARDRADALPIIIHSAPLRTTSPRQHILHRQDARPRRVDEEPRALALPRHQPRNQRDGGGLVIAVGEVADDVGGGGLGAQQRRVVEVAVDEAGARERRGHARALGAAAHQAREREVRVGGRDRVQRVAADEAGCAGSAAG